MMCDDTRYVNCEDEDPDIEQQFKRIPRPSYTDNKKKKEGHATRQPTAQATRQPATGNRPPPHSTIL
jgi:hypothetical protein